MDTNQSRSDHSRTIKPSRRQVLGAAAASAAVLPWLGPVPASRAATSSVLVSEGQPRAVIVPPPGVELGTVDPIEVDAASGAVVAPMRHVTGDVDGTSITWAESDTANSGTVTVRFTVTASRVYQFVAQVWATNGSSDSFFVRVDDGPEATWALGITGYGTWRWATVPGPSTGTPTPLALRLEPGTHTLTLRGREPGARFSRLRIEAQTSVTQLGHSLDTLVSYVARATGVTLSVVDSSESPDDLPAGRIYVGWAGPHGAAVTPLLQGLDGDGLVIHSTGTDVCLLGPTDWGTRFAVYELLERHLGVRWLLPGDQGTDVPATARIAVPAGTVRQQPSFYGRTLPYWFDTNEPNARDWASDDPQVAWAAQQRTHSRVTKVGNHNLYTLFPTRVYADPSKPTYRPEIYPVIDGRTVVPRLGATSGWQPRFDIAETVEIAVAHIIDYFDQNPDEPLISLAVNDGKGHSETDLDFTLINSVGQPSASQSYYAWVNTVVATVQTRRPDLEDKIFPVLAYDSVIDPPDFDLHPSVVPMITKESHLWDDPIGRDAIRTLFDGWSGRATTWALYDYSSGARFLVPRLYNPVLQEVYQLGHSLGMRYSYSDMAPTVGEGPKAWVIGKLMWDVDADVEELTREWCERTVGSRAAPYLRSYFRMWETFWSGVAHETGFWEFNLPRIYMYFQLVDYLAQVTPEDVRQARQLLETAVARADTPDRRARAEMIMATFAYYESGFLSYPGPVPAPDTTAQALKLAATMRRTLPQRVATAARRVELDAGIEADPVLRGRTDHQRFQHSWTGFNGSELWHLVDQLRAGNPSGGALSRSLTDHVAEGDPHDPAVRVSRLALRIAQGRAPQLAPNGSFDAGMTDAPPWRFVGDFVRSDTGGYDGGPALRLPVMPSSLATREQSLVLPIPIGAGLCAYRLRFKGPGQSQGGAVSIKIHLWTSTGANIYAYQQPTVRLADSSGDWSWISLCEDIPAQAKGQTVAQIRLVASLLGFEADDDAWFDDIEVYSENESLGSVG